VVPGRIHRAVHCLPLGLLLGLIRRTSSAYLRRISHLGVPLTSPSHRTLFCAIVSLDCGRTRYTDIRVSYPAILRLARNILCLAYTLEGVAQALYGALLGALGESYRP
jgi:hypothetical protein